MQEDGGEIMAVVKATNSDIDLMARLLRAEAEGEGIRGMQLVGNVGINQVRANCSDFKNIRTIPQMVCQEHAFEAVQHGYFYQRATEAFEAKYSGRTVLACKIQLMVFQAAWRLPPCMV